MNHRSHVVALASVAVIAFAAGRIELSNANASSPRVQDEPTHALSKEAQAIFDAATPGPHHKVLDQVIGQWECVFTSRTSPDATPVVSHGSVEREWVLGGRFVRETVRLEGDAGAFEGIGYIGFDNIDAQYRRVWMDSANTAISYDTGTYHPDAHVMHIRSGHRDPVSGRLVNTWSKLDMSVVDRHTLLIHSTDPSGRTYPALEGVLERLE